jgi:DNA-binding CsgD family transcriptional regulator
VPTSVNRRLFLALGISTESATLYERVVRMAGQSVAAAAESMRTTEAQLADDLAELISVGAVRIDDSRVSVVSPGDLMLGLIDESAHAAAANHARLMRLARAVPYLTGRDAGPLPGQVDEVRAIDGELNYGGPIPSMLRRAIEGSTGDFVWLRPDQWTTPYGAEVTEVLGHQVALGRRSRAIYPVAILAEAPEVIRHRRAMGEELRVLPSVPTRLAVIGDSLGILPEPLGTTESPRSLIRQPGLLQLMTLLFEVLWEQALPVDEQVELSVEDGRRILLEQLAAGSTDDQIARRLGVSLRTVRRRVAELLAELDADSRFQAGVRAARRGWL